MRLLTTTENIKKLLELATDNRELQDKLSKASKKELTQIASENGITLTEADFETQSAEISDDELDAVAGGKKCTCIMGGGGTGEDKNGTKTCACVGGGYGQMQNGDSRCYCAVGGWGSNHKR